MANARNQHLPHRNRNIPYHLECEFRKEAFVWAGNRPIATNFYPFGTEIRKWMLQQPNSLPVFTLGNAPYANPYTYDASVLAYAYQFVINDGAAFSRATIPLNPYIAEITRLRLYSENVLYTARLCEALIKQLLFCTTFVESEYSRAALGALLSKNCAGCHNSEGKRHKLSLLGSLAHRYQLCHKYEHCLEKHLPLVNRQRNLEAAHSGVTEFSPSEAAVVRSRFDKQLSDIGEDFIHILQHISEIEVPMLAELDGIIESTQPRAAP